MFMPEKGKVLTGVTNGKELWDFALPSDVTHILNALNTKLQG
jgi:hypothetical protein